MSPIKNLSDTVRLPRIGKIQLGTKHPEKGYPMKADHFVFPKDHPDYQKLVDMFGAEAKELRILIPVEEDEIWGSQYYKCYNLTYGLVCKGDGEKAIRMIDTKTQEIPDSKVPTGAPVCMVEIPCNGNNCPVYKSKEKGKPSCHEVMNFRFIIPEVPGLGIWQIDTGSKNSILNLNSSARLIKRAFGRLSMIPLKLTFEPIQVNNPDTGKKQTVYVLNLRTDVTLSQLATVAKEQSKMFQLEPPDLEAVYDAQVEQDIEALFPGTPQVDKTTGEVKPPQTAKGVTSEPPQPSTAETDSPPPAPEKPSENDSSEVRDLIWANGINWTLLKTTLQEKQITQAEVVKMLRKEPYNKKGVDAVAMMQSLTPEEARHFVNAVSR